VVVFNACDGAVERRQSEFSREVLEVSGDRFSDGLAIAGAAWHLDLATHPVLSSREWAEVALMDRRT
jgi:hypothetical protein